MQTAAGEWLDLKLGSPGREHACFGPAESVALDEAAAFPAAACRALDDLGLGGYYVPVGLGGLLSDHLELVELLRAVARRDLTVAIAHGKTFLGSAPVWVAADDLADRLAAAVLQGTCVAWGLTERDHGSDLLAGELAATRLPTGGWRLDGEKWLINNATRARLICVLARTDPAGGPRGFSLFLVDKLELADGTWCCRAKVTTHGIRGADISGIAFDGAEVAATTLVGEVGEGLELVLKTLQLTRTCIASLSLGAGDTAFRLTSAHVAEQVRSGHRQVDQPWIRRTLGQVAASLLLAEATAVLGARAIQELTGELAVISAVTKALVPTLVQEAIDRMAEILGERAVLTGHFADGRFAKLERDHRIVAVFDGNTAVSRNALIDHFPLLASGYRRGTVDSTGLRAAAEPAGAPTPFDPGRLVLVATRGCSVVQALPAVVARLQSDAVSGEIPQGVRVLATAVLAATDDLHVELGALRRSARSVPASAFALAERYELCYAAAACLQLWAAADPGRRDPMWLTACLRAALDRLGPATEAGEEAGTGAVYDALADRVLRVGPGALHELLPRAAGIEKAVTGWLA